MGRFGMRDGEEDGSMSNLDEALERFLLVDLEYAGGFANHGPMAAEALESIGHQSLIPAFVDSYAPRLPLAGSGRALRPDEREAARGNPARRADWTAHFEAALESGDWKAVALPAVHDLLPGLAAAAGHGLLRTFHAMRALEREDNGVRRQELARGLAYWSSKFQRLPGEPGRAAEGTGSTTGEGAGDPGRWLAGIPVLAGKYASTATFEDALRRLEGDGAFLEAIERIPLPDARDVDAFLAATCRAAAGLYLAHSGSRIAYVHAVTIPSAMRWLAPRLDPEDARRGAGFAFQAVAAFHAVMGETPTRESVDDDVRRTAESWDEIRYRAACSLEEHAVKLAEACWREDRRTPDPVFRLAAADAALRLEGNPNAAR